MVFKFIGKVIFLNIIPLFLYFILLMLIGRLINLYGYDLSNYMYIVAIITGIIAGVITIIITGIFTGIITGIFIGIITGQSSITSLEYYQLNLLVFFIFLLLLLSIMYNNYRIRHNASKKIRKRYLLILIAVHNAVYLYSFVYVFMLWLMPRLPH